MESAVIKESPQYQDYHQRMVEKTPYSYRDFDTVRELDQRKRDYAMDAKWVRQILPHADRRPVKVPTHSDFPGHWYASCLHNINFRGDDLTYKEGERPWIARVIDEDWLVDKSKGQIEKEMYLASKFVMDRTLDKGSNLDPSETRYF